MFAYTETQKKHFWNMKIGIVLLSFVLLAKAIKVKFCSEPNFEGSCATKTYDPWKCEHLPWRFRWIYDVRSVKIQPSFFGSCRTHCELHSKRNCGRSLLSLVMDYSKFTSFDCNTPIGSIAPDTDFDGVICFNEAIFG